MQVAKSMKVIDKDNAVYNRTGDAVQGVEDNDYRDGDV